MLYPGFVLFLLCCNVTSVGWQRHSHKGLCTWKIKMILCMICLCFTTNEEIHPTFSWCASEENKAWHASRAHAASQAASSQDTCLGTRTVKDWRQPTNYWDYHETPCQYGEMEKAVSPLPTSPLQGKPLPQYFDFHGKEIPAQELKGQAGAGAGEGMFSAHCEKMLCVSMAFRYFRKEIRSIFKGRGPGKK